MHLPIQYPVCTHCIVQGSPIAVWLLTPAMYLYQTFHNFIYFSCYTYKKYILLQDDSFPFLVSRIR